MDALRASALVKRFDTTTAVDGVQISIAQGEVRGLLGANGAGKTTLLRMLFGLVRPDAGSIELLGHPVDTSNPAPIEGVAGFVEEPSFYPYLSGRANLELLVELDGASATPSIDDALERVDLARRGGDRVGGYSTGMRQRLGIAAALLRSPRLLLLDEPTSGLDPAGARAIAVLVRELSAAGVAVLLSSHQIGELEKVCDAYTVLRQGRVVWDGTAEALRTQAPASAYALATSDDALALELAAAQPGVRARRLPAGAVGNMRSAQGELSLFVENERLDTLVLALGRADVAIRRLELLVSPLESMFFALTSDDAVDDLEPYELAEKVLARA